MLAELLGRCTSMPVAEAADGEKVQAGHVYVIPPDATLTVGDGALRVAKPAPPRQYRWPINALFTSLAKEHGDHAVCVVLSGSGSDGAHGLRAVKEHGGLTLAQAGFDHVAMTGMPASAAATGLVDQVLPVEDMPARLLAHYNSLRDSRGKQDADGTREDVASNLQTICDLLRAETGHDFSQYKEKTLVRRIQRRMQVVQAAGVPDYVAYLRREPGEYELLFNELLINVTEFFRDPAAFEALETHALPALLAGKNASDTLRVWVPGCATGEEAYSIAIALKEATPRGKPQPKIMIFATDIDTHAIEFARAGRYRAPLQGISAERRERWFTESGDDYCVIKQIREMCVFSLHSVIKDPPFSRLDLISCRNLLIYLNAEAQQRLIRVFHYALRPGGFLLLGPSESVSRNQRLFSALDKKQRLYARRDDGQSGIPVLPAKRRGERETYAVGHAFAEGRVSAEGELDRAARRVMEKYSPAHVVIDARRDIVRFAGDTGKYLGPSSGTANLNLFTLLHRGLRNAARQAVSQAFATGQPASAERLADLREGDRQPLRVVVEPLPDQRPGESAGADSRLYLVTFIELEKAPTASTAVGVGEDGARLHALEHELETTRTQLQSAIDEQEAATEELKSANEEYQSVNEELQSSNEELETSKEEMQSINEELQTVNAELSSKNDALARLNSDLRNLLESTQIATIFLDEHLHIRGFTPPMTDVFHLREGDRGRPITEIAPNIDYPDLRSDVKHVLRNLGMVERILRHDDHGPVYLLRMRPYRTVDNVIDGVVVTFVDVTESQRLNQEHARLAAIVNASKDAIFGISLPDRITSWNPAAEELFGLPAAQVIGQRLATLLPADASQQTRDFFASAERETRLGAFHMTWVRPDGERMPLQMNWAPVRDEQGNVIAGEIFARDMREQAEAERSATLMMRELDHRVKNTLATVQAIAQQTLRGAASVEDFQDAFMARLMSLSKTHNLLAHGGWSGTGLRELVEGELQPYQHDDEARVEIRGEPVILSSKAALALSMALHELATNAAKYGALSVPDGRVAVDWETAAAKGRQHLRLRWRECRGPPVTQPERFGFGHRLITDGLAYELDGTVELEFAATGVVCTMDIPVPRAIAE
jgi:two-component system CheB/CheR fusion protein